MALRALAGIFNYLQIWWHSAHWLRSFFTYRFDGTQSIGWDLSLLTDLMALRALAGIFLYLQIWWHSEHWLRCSFLCCPSGKGSNNTGARSAITRRRGSRSALWSGNTGKNGARGRSRNRRCPVQQTKPSLVCTKNTKPYSQFLYQFKRQYILCVSCLLTDIVCFVLLIHVCKHRYGPPVWGLKHKDD